MKRLTLCVVLLLISSGPGVRAQGVVQCIQPNTCNAPPCAFMIELEHAMASKRSAAAAIARVASVVTEREVTKSLGQYASECPAWAKQREEAYQITEEPKRAEGCSIGLRQPNGGVKTAATLDDFKGARNTCSEIVAAEFDRLSTMRDQCQATSIGVRRASTLSDLTGELEAISMKVGSLQASLLKYVMSCVPPADLARELSRHGLGALVEEDKAAYDSWWAKRAR